MAPRRWRRISSPCRSTRRISSSGPRSGKRAASPLQRGGQHRLRTAGDLSQRELVRLRRRRRSGQRSRRGPATLRRLQRQRCLRARSRRRRCRARRRLHALPPAPRSLARARLHPLSAAARGGCEARAPIAEDRLLSHRRSPSHRRRRFARRAGIPARAGCADSLRRRLDAGDLRRLGRRVRLGAARPAAGHQPAGEGALLPELTRRPQQPARRERRSQQRPPRAPDAGPGRAAGAQAQPAAAASGSDRAAYPAGFGATSTGSPAGSQWACGEGGVSRRYHSASSAPMQPVPAAVTAWR